MGEGHHIKTVIIKNGLKAWVEFNWPKKGFGVGGGIELSGPRNCWVFLGQPSD
jgi:hypothetical protein